MLRFAVRECLGGRDHAGTNLRQAQFAKLSEAQETLSRLIPEVHPKRCKACSDRERRCYLNFGVIRVAGTETAVGDSWQRSDSTR